MLGVKIVAKLYDVPPSDGAITAFDASGTCVFVGTDKGMVQKFEVRVEQQAEGTDSGDARIFTTLVKTHQVSRAEKRIARLEHSSSKDCALLFVLCAKVLSIHDSATLAPLQEVRAGIGAFATSALRGQRHLICACEKYGKAIHVYSFDGAARGEAPKHVQELLLPESVQTLLEYNGILCVGLRREYSLLSIADGDAKSLLALNGREPHMALGDGEVYLRLHSAVFVVSVRAMPVGKGSVLRRTVRFDSEPVCLAVQHPYLFAFTENACDVYCSYEDEVIERLPVQGCVLAKSAPSGPLFFCSRTRLWMMLTYPLRAQLEDLVARYKIEDAFHLLRSQPPSEELRRLEIDLNVMAGFAHLYHNTPMLAMGHFNEHIDVREILCHVPELVPVRAVEPGEDAEEDAFWAAWRPQHPHNRHSADLEGAWRGLFESLPLVANNLAHRLLDGAQVDLGTFLREAWDGLRRALISWLRSRAATAPEPQRRCIEYALLVLYLNARDHRSLFRLITMESALSLRDCAPLLRERGQWRLLLALTARKGDEAAAAAIFVEHLDLTQRCQRCPEAATPPLSPEMLARVRRCVGRHGGEAAEDRGAATNVHEIFFAVEGLNLRHLATVIREDPRALLVTDDTGSTVLHHACALHTLAGQCDSPADRAVLQQQLAIVAMLVDCGCDVEAVNLGGQSPLSLALAAPRKAMDSVAGCLLGAATVREWCNGYAFGSGVPRERLRFGAVGAPTPAGGSWCGHVAPP